MTPPALSIWVLRLVLPPDGRLMCLATIMGGFVRMVVRGNTGCCNLRHATGSVIVLPVTLLAFMPTVDNTMWVI